MQRPVDSLEVETLTRVQAARKAQVSISSIDRAIYTGDLRARRIGSRVIILQSEFARWLRGDESPQSDQPTGEE